MLIFCLVVIGAILLLWQMMNVADRKPGEASRSNSNTEKYLGGILVVALILTIIVGMCVLLYFHNEDMKELGNNPIPWHS